MIVVEKKNLPHGNIPFNRIKDLETRSVVMKMNENMTILANQLKNAQNAIIELQRR